MARRPVRPLATAARLAVALLPPASVLLEKPMRCSRRPKLLPAWGGGGRGAGAVAAAAVAAATASRLLLAMSAAMPSGSGGRPSLEPGSNSACEAASMVGKMHVIAHETTCKPSRQPCTQPPSLQLFTCRRSSWLSVRSRMSQLGPSMPASLHEPNDTSLESAAT